VENCGRDKICDLCGSFFYDNTDNRVCPICEATSSGPMTVLSKSRLKRAFTNWISSWVCLADGLTGLVTLGFWRPDLLMLYRVSRLFRKIRKSSLMQKVIDMALESEACSEYSEVLALESEAKDLPVPPDDYTDFTNQYPVKELKDDI